MVKEKQYLIDTLKKAGIKSHIYTSMKKLAMAGELQTGGVLKVREELTRSGSKKNYTDEEGRRKRRYKLWQRESILRVIIADSDEDRVEQVFTQFLKIVDKGVEEERNWEGIEINSVDWVEKEDNILKAKVAVQFDVTFTGGVYVDKLVRKIGIGNIEVKKSAGG